MSSQKKIKNLTPEKIALYLEKIADTKINVKGYSIIQNQNIVNLIQRNRERGILVS